MLRRAYLLTGDRASAEDLVQEALARACAASARRHIDQVEGYVHKTMVNLATSRWRRWARLREVPTEPVPDLLLIDGIPELDERGRMCQVLRELPPRQRAVLVLRFYEDLGESEIAEAMRVSVGTVRSQTARGLRRMRAVLDEMNEVERSS